jgi:hypothetical protein
MDIAREKSVTSAFGITMSLMFDWAIQQGTFSLPGRSRRRGTERSSWRTRSVRPGDRMGRDTVYFELDGAGQVHPAPHPRGVARAAPARYPVGRRPNYKLLATTSSSRSAPPSGQRNRLRSGSRTCGSRRWSSRMEG